MAGLKSALLGRLVWGRAGNKRGVRAVFWPKLSWPVPKSWIQPRRPQLSLSKNHVSLLFALSEGNQPSSHQLGSCDTVKVQLLFSLSCVRCFCNPMDCSPPVSSVRGIFQARILARVAISSSRVSSQYQDRTRVSRVGRWVLYPEPAGKPA